ncbi:MAG: tyrosine-type recombinase/integrase [Acidimicrobiales bacterium]
MASFGSENTRQAYRRDLVDFLGFCDEHRVEPLDVTRPVVDAYARTLDGDGKAPSTVARRLSALASFYRYLVDEDVLVVSPIDRVRRPRVSDESPRLGLDRREAANLLAVAAEAGPRDDALIALLMLNGLRVSEAISLDISDLDNERGHQVVHVTGKGGKRRTAPLAPRTVAAVFAAIDGRTAGPVLVDGDGERMNRHQAQRAVRRLARRAGITKTISPHSLRHTMVTQALDAGVPIHVVQDAAGHASPDTTRRYDRARHALDGHATYLLAQYIATA